MTQLKDDDYQKSRSKVLERCKDLRLEKSMYEQKGQYEKASKIQAHIDWMLQVVEMFDQAIENGEIREQE